MIGLRSFLCGEWQTGTGKAVDLVNPATEETVARAISTGATFDSAITYGREVGGAALRRMPFAERGQMLGQMSKALQGVRDALIEASIVNAGTTRSDAKFDVDGATGTLAFYAALGEKLGDRRTLVEGAGEQLARSARFWGHHVRVPRRGVAVHVNAFNFPAWGLAEKAAVALLAGVPVISKPATSTALLAYRIMERLVEAQTFVPGALQFVCGSTGDLLERLGGQDVLAFTGSGQTGALFRALKNVVSDSVRVNVEADSLNAAVLGADVEAGSETYQMFLRDVVKEMTQKAGQKCTATRRIFVPEALIDRVQEDITERLESIRVGNPSLEDTQMGPLATAQQLHDVRAGIAKLESAGARRVFGTPERGEVHGVGAEKGFFIGPVLLRADVPANARAVHEHEVFGPCATIMPYVAASSAVDLVARGSGGLVASVYSDDRAVIEELVLGVAPYHGRVLIGSRKVADQAISPGLVLPSCVHGGPGRAGGGEELGGARGLEFYMQRTAIQGDRAVLDKMLGVSATE